MRGYGQFCPVAKAAEVFDERWTPLFPHELARAFHDWIGASHFVKYGQTASP